MPGGAVVSYVVALTVPVTVAGGGGVALAQAADWSGRPTKQGSVAARSAGMVNCCACWFRRSASACVWPWPRWYGATRPPCHWPPPAAAARTVWAGSSGAAPKGLANTQTRASSA